MCDGSYIAEYTRKARKAHKCCACGYVIPKGFQYVIYAGRADSGDSSSFYTDKWHVECREEFGENLRYWGDDCGLPEDTWEDGFPENIKAKYGIKETLQAEPV